MTICAAAEAQTGNIAVVNARIYTMDPRKPLASSMRVRQGVIVSVGDDAKIAGAIDAHGAAILPGLIDSHGHVQALGRSLEALDLRGIASEAEIAAKVLAVASQSKAGEWIVGAAWDQNLWASKQFPSSDSLSSAAPDNPVALTRIDEHAIWVNRRALEIADINTATPDPQGGKIVRDSVGRPTGVLLDRARVLIDRKIPEPTAGQVERRILAGLEECAHLGITTVHDAWVSTADVDAYHSLVRNRQMPVRVYAMAFANGAGPALDAWLAKGPEIGDYFTLRTIKLVADGALGSRGAALLEPYSDDPNNRGLLILDRTAIRAVAQKVAAHGFQLATHAIGDAANRAAIDAYGDVLASPNDRRFRIEHAQIVNAEDVAKFRQYSVVASMQPTHATSDMPWAEARLGPERLRGAYAWQTFMKLGVHVPCGSDFPIENPNPVWGLYAAITRQDKSGLPTGGWIPAQRMSREEALGCWTLEGAYAAFQEKQKGSLEPGKLGDFIMLSDDVMTMPANEIWKARVTMTVVAGKVVYRQ